MNIFKKIFGNNQNDKKEVITMTNTEKAITLINTFATGDTEKASELLAENYIQHNLAYSTGRGLFAFSYDCNFLSYHFPPLHHFVTPLLKERLLYGSH